MQKYLPFIMYYGSALLLFICKVHCLQTLIWQVTAHWVIEPYLGKNFRPAPLTVFEILGFKLKNKNENWVYVVVYKHVTQLRTC